ncbi:hypothetical protein G7054_g12892 [Neopestalotiopsis clavispora]|nr:hypothetical protein G7054_g12892 [Neopestalotiopsis clavispora]
MHFKIPFTIIASLGLAQAFTLPADIGDGIYSVHVDESGKDQVTYLGPIDTTAPRNQLCYSSEATLAYEEITRECGQYQSGWWLFGSNKNYGYENTGRTLSENDILTFG